MVHPGQVVQVVYTGIPDTIVYRDPTTSALAHTRYFKTVMDPRDILARYFTRDLVYLILQWWTPPENDQSPKGMWRLRHPKQQIEAWALHGVPHHT